jgi:hypothetical protein
MRTSTLGWVLSIALLLPNVGTAQVLLRPTPYPQVTAATALWQVRGDPVFHGGVFYYPKGPTVFFDGNVMNRTDTFEGVPVYADATQTPFSVIYIPIGGNLVRPYERVRDGELAGTVGSRTPSFPIQRDGEVSVAATGAPIAVGTTGIIAPPGAPIQSVAVVEAPEAVGTAGVSTSPIAGAAPTRPVRRANTPSLMELWVPFDGARWYSAGSAVSYSAERFVQVGEYVGFPVYRDRNGSRDVIYIPSVAGGAVAPYKKNR